MRTDFGSVMAQETPEEVGFKRPAPEQANEDAQVKRRRFSEAISMLLSAAEYSDSMDSITSEDVRSQENMSPTVENGESSPKSDNGGNPENTEAMNSPEPENACSNEVENQPQPESSSPSNPGTSSSNENSMDKDYINPGIWVGERGWNSCGSSPELSPRRGSSRLPPSIPSTDPVSQIMTTAQEDFNDVSCYCQKPYGGRPMIECSECKKWIHLSCAKIRKNNIPEVFMCQKCRDAKFTTRKSSRTPKENGWYASQ